MTTIDSTTLIGWIIFAVINSATTVITARYTNRMLDKLKKSEEEKKDGK